MKNIKEMRYPEGIDKKTRKLTLLTDKKILLLDKAYDACDGFRIKIKGEITLPENVIFCGDHIFESNQITKVNFSKSITIIPNSIFLDNKITEVNLPENIIAICKVAFAHNKITKIFLPESLIFVDEYAFYSNDLSEVTIPQNVKYLSFFSFTENSNLIKVTLSKKLYDSSNLLMIFGDQVENYFDHEGNKLNIEN